MKNININDYRTADYPIDEMFLNRWSPRSFSEQEVDEETLKTVFEASRWAPSAMNKQPWRFILARTEEDRKKFHSFIMDGNLAWCTTVPAFALVISDTEAGGAHAFDTGTAWGYLALQAMQKGLITHAMGGFYKDKAREVLNIPEQYEIHAVVAIGYQDEKEKLEEKFQERELPSDRRPLTETVMEGEFRA
ncbi:nitroreductase family protein [Gracilibacillus salitolerans]|uniref:Nitroreductase family protein n=1 Tax=Gracilibacillus salitolerans TaxID=2663022 RepID=A0A5Q2TMV8_9BACI|nr:nitroreductase family protein [Gracilibacillus salitolerans]QGH36294.1 nitroreductase family protein [Gracilibacillus salitolerans]